MRHEDLGALEGRVLLYGGPYSNLHATQALFDVADGLGIPREHRICTGDVVAYCADPVASVDNVRSRGGPVVAGNCELQLAAGAPDCGCGFEDGSACDLLSVGWFSHADRLVGPECRSWMGDLPDILSFAHAGKRYAVVHGGATAVNRFIWPTDPDSVFVEEIAAIEAVAGKVEGVIAGHCGLAFTRQVAGVAWINAGVIGTPPNDGGTATRYTVLENGAVRMEDLVYDAAAARRAMEAAGLVQGYHTGLTTGYWPSEEVLPPELRASG